MIQASNTEQIHNLLQSHNEWRSRTLNMTPSENVMSPIVLATLSSDLLGRYADYSKRDLTNRRYRGTAFISELEQLIEKLAQDIFGAQYVELRPISGHLAGVAVLAALCDPGDIVFEVSREGGGHREAAKFGLPPLFSLEVKYLPFNSERFNVDIEAACSMIEKHRPRVVILGSSNFLFPHPVRQIKAAMQQINPESILLYDGSHVMGFLAVGEFQKPLEEGADVVFGSTHKTLPGPQGGIILTNREDLIDRISEAVYPALVTNHHAFRMPALGLALGEIEEFGHDYIEQVSANAHILGSALEERGVPCIKVDGKYSCSHIILAIVSRFGTGEKIALRLEEAGIITTSTQLPDIMSKEGIRFGVQEITRIGATNDDMSMVAELISQAIMQDRPTAEIAQDVFAFRSSLGSIHFTWRST